MSNLPSDVSGGEVFGTHEVVQATPLAVVASVRGGDAISAVEAEFFPLVEEIIPLNSNA